MNFSELLVVIVVALIVFSPKKIPELAQTLGYFLRMIQTLKTQLCATFEPIEKHLRLEDNKARAEKADNEPQ